MDRNRARRLLTAFTSTSWAIEEEKLEAICDLIELRAAGGRRTEDEIRAVTRARESRVVQGGGGVVVIPVTGVITQRAGMMTQYSGGTSTEKLGAQFDQAMANGDIRAIVFDVDSPGGNVEGVPELAAKIYEARGKKRVVAVVNSLMASAAYWIGSACDEVVCTPSGLTGSIGVFSVHTEFSEMDAKLGVKTTIIRAGKFKAEANSFEPLSDEAEGHIQATVDEYYGLFTAAVATHRKTSVEAVRGGYGQGRTLTAKASKRANLVDRIATLEDVLVDLGVNSERLAAARAYVELPKIAAINADLFGRYDLPGFHWTGTGPGSQVSIEFAAEEEVGDSDDESDPDDEYTQDDEDEEDDEMVEASAGEEGGTPAPDRPAPTLETAPAAEGEEAMSDKTVAAPGGATVQVGEEAVTRERERTAWITAMCGKHGVPGKASEFIQSGASKEQVGQFLLDNALAQKAAEPVQDLSKPVVDMSEKENRRYSIAKAILEQSEGNLSGLEKEIHDELSGRFTNRQANGGVLVPTHLGLPEHERQRRGNTSPQAVLETDGSNKGEHFVFTEPGSFIDLLRNRLVIARMGATFLPGLQGNVGFPKQTGAGTFSWRADNPGSDVALSDLASAIVTLTPKNGTSATSFSRQLLAQSVINVEQLVRLDLASITALGLDLTALHGATGGDNPVGIYAASGVNAVAVDGVIDYAAVVDMETEIIADNADLGTMGYVTTPGIRGAAKKTQQFSGTNGMPIWTGSVAEGEMNGYRSMASNQIASDLGDGSDEHGLIFGSWPSLMVGEWGAMEILADPYTKKRQALIEVVVFVLADVQLRYAEAFCKATGLVLSAS